MSYLPEKNYCGSSTTNKVATSSERIFFLKTVSQKSILYMFVRLRTSKTLLEFVFQTLNEYSSINSSSTSYLLRCTICIMLLSNFLGLHFHRTPSYLTFDLSVTAIFLCIVFA